jgi:hypothetical protein
MVSEVSRFGAPTRLKGLAEPWPYRLMAKRLRSPEAVV